MPTKQNFRGPLNSHPPSPTSTRPKARPDAHYSLHPSSSHTRHTTSPYTSNAAPALTSQPKSHPPARILIDATLSPPHQLPSAAFCSASTITIPSPSSQTLYISAPPRILLSISSRDHSRPTTILTALPPLARGLSNDTSTTTIQLPSPLNLTSPLTHFSQILPTISPPASLQQHRQSLPTPATNPTPTPSPRSYVSLRLCRALHFSCVTARRVAVGWWTLPRRALQRKRDQSARAEYEAHCRRVDEIVAGRRREVRAAGGVPFGEPNECVWGWWVRQGGECGEGNVDGMVGVPLRDGSGSGRVVESDDLEMGLRDKGEQRGPPKRMHRVGEWFVRVMGRMERRVGGFKEVAMREENWRLRWALMAIFLLLVGLGICVGALVVIGTAAV